jgi:SAM-dependent methyltransferase
MVNAANVIERERQFYNASHGRYRQLRELIWRAIGPFNRNEELNRLYDPRGKRVLLYGCGPANEASQFIKAGATSVAGIDISDVEIAVAWEQARAGEYADVVDFRAEDAQETSFPTNAFDLIVGSAILHHLDLRKALSEIRRILAPGGRAVFLEPLAHNLLLRIGRRFTPQARTADEHPLTVDDWSVCGEVFPAFTHREVELLSIPLMPVNLLVPLRWQRRLARRVSAFDDVLLDRYPTLRKYARTTMIVLE